MKSFTQIINESSLNRVIHHTKNTNIGMITAHRGEHSAEENHARNQSLKKDIRDAGHGYVHIKGHYTENKGTPEERKVHEHSFLVIGKKGADSGNLKHFLKKSGEKYGQDSVLHKEHDKEHATLIGTSKSSAFLKHEEELNVGKFSPHKTGEYHSALRNKGKRTFAFESLEAIEYPTLEDISFEVTIEPSFFNRGPSRDENF